MLTDPKKPELRLIMQCSIPIEESLEGEVFYKILKDVIQNHSADSTINGQVIKMLEPCCNKKGVQTNAEKNTEVV